MHIGPGIRRTLASIASARFRLLTSVDVMVHGRPFSLPAGSAIDLAAWYEDGVVRTAGMPFDGWFEERVELRDVHGTVVFHTELRGASVFRSQACSVRVE